MAIKNFLKRLANPHPLSPGEPSGPSLAGCPPELGHGVSQAERRGSFHDMRHPVCHKLPPCWSEGPLCLPHQYLHLWVHRHPLSQPVLSYQHDGLQPPGESPVHLEQRPPGALQRHAVSCHPQWWLEWQEKLMFVFLRKTENFNAHIAADTHIDDEICCQKEMESNHCLNLNDFQATRSRRADKTNCMTIKRTTQPHFWTKGRSQIHFNILTCQEVIFKAKWFWRKKTNIPIVNRFPPRFRSWAVMMALLKIPWVCDVIVGLFSQHDCSFNKLYCQILPVCLYICLKWCSWRGEMASFSSPSTSP